MQEECDVYVDPEEDEVFFGCISDRERNIYGKVSEQGGSIPDDRELKKHLYNPCDEVRIGGENESFNITDVKLTGKTYEEPVNNESLENADLSILRKDLNGSLNKDEESGIICLNNTSVELDHSYSTPMKQKIDKSILSTPKSIVKADKDGGFLKVLSEIALVKAEADKKSESIEKNDEDKENQIIYKIPEIRITEASPEKISIKSPHGKTQKTKFKRFKIVYNSPKSPERVSPKKGVGSKALAENFESSQNLKNISLDKDMNTSGLKEVESIVNNDITGSREFLNKSVNLIELNDSYLSKDIEKMKQAREYKIEEEISKPQIQSPVERNKCLNKVDKLQSEVVSLKCDSSDKFNDESIKDKKVEDNEEIQIIVQLSTDIIDLKEKSSKEGLSDTIVIKGTVTDEATNYEGFNMNLLPDVDPMKSKETQHWESSENIPKDLKSEVKNSKETQKKPIPGYRFSKEARKIVEGLKKAAVDDTLNFTIQEIDVENTENSFVSPEPVSIFDETIIASKNVQSVTDFKKTPKIMTKTSISRPRTVEPTRRPFSPVLSQSKIPSAKYLSDRKVQLQGTMEARKCVKKLPLEGKATPRVEEKLKGDDGKTVEKDFNLVPSSRIPVFGLKACKPVATTQVAPGKVTPLKTHKNPKFKNIESPINAYIHNKPTALVVNVKPEPKKDRLAEVWKKHALGSGYKAEDKRTNGLNPKKVTAQATATAPLPFVQYKSATPYKVEKRPESRLPRLAPSVQKLIGNHSPKVLKHEGRFYVKTPRQQVSYEDSTIVADANEVSVVLSQIAQKSNTIK